MKLLSCHIENFGTLHAADLSFQPGLNVLREENGWGKSTLAAFLKAMLYGLPSSRKSDLDENDRRRYKPWQGGAWGGSLIFTAGGKTYRAERFFDAVHTRDRFALYDLADNQPSADFSENLGEDLFGVDAAAFERTAYLPQKLLPDKIENSSITAKFNHLINDSDDVAGYDRAMEALEKERKIYSKKNGNGGRIAELTESIAEAYRQKAACEEAAAEAGKCLAEAEELQNRISAGEQALDTMQMQAEEAGRMRTRQASLSHGCTLLAQQEALIEKAAECRALLGDRYDDDLSFEKACSAAKQVFREYLILDDRYRSAGIQLRNLTEQTEALRHCFPHGVPAEEEIREAEQLVAGRAVLLSDNTAQTEIPELLSEQELSGHLKQAAALASIEEDLSRPYDDSIIETTLQSISARSPETIPGDAVLLGWESDAQELLQCCQKIRQAEEHKAAMEVVYADTVPANLPGEEELLDMQNRYQGLQAQKTEIDQLELQQHTLLDAARDEKQRKRNLRTVGILLLVLGAVGAVIGWSRSLELLLYASLVPVIGGAVFLIASFCRRKPAAEDPLERLQKRLASCKASYEDSRTAILSFFDTYGPESLPGLDGSEANHIYELFHAISAKIRHREDVLSQKAEAEQSIETFNARRLEIGTHLAPYFSRCGRDTAAPEELPGAIAAYRTRVAEARRIIEDAVWARNRRSEQIAAAARLTAELNAYLAALEEQFPQGIPNVEREDYLAKLMAWKTQVGRLTQQNRARQQMIERKAELDSKIAAFCAREDAAAASALDGDAPTEETEWERVCRHSRSFHEKEKEKREVQHTLSCLSSERAEKQTSLETFLSSFSLPADAEYGERLRMAEDAFRTLGETRPKLKEAVRNLRTFCAEQNLKEEDLRAYREHPEESKPQQDPAAEQRSAELKKVLAETREEKARLWEKAEQLSRKGEALADWQEKILRAEEDKRTAEYRLEVLRQTESFLTESKAALSSRYIGVMQERFRAYYTYLTDCADEAGRITLDSAMQMQMEVDGERRPGEYLSRGFRDLTALCIRFALVDALYAGEDHKEELPLLILDDPFVNLDDRKLSAARKLLDRMAGRYQILYFICHESRS